MNGNDRFLNINDAHLRVMGGNVHASSFNLDQISITTTSTTASTIDFLNETTAFTARSNIEVGTANLFVNTETSNVGIRTSSPEYALDVHGPANVSVLTASSNVGVGTFSPEYALDVHGPANVSVLTASSNVGVGTFSPEYALDVHGPANVSVLTASSNVGVGTFSPEYALDVHGSANVGALTATTFSGSGAGLTALDAANITTGTLNAARVPIPTTFGGATFSGDVTVDTNTFHVDTTDDRVGIGTTTPDKLLHLEDSVPTIRFVDTDTTVDSNQQLGGIEFYSRDSTASGYPNYELASIKCVNSANAGSAPDGELTFSTGRHTGTGILEMMRINADGNVGIGKTDPGTALDVLGTIRVQTGTNDATGGEFSIDTNVGHIRRKVGGNGVSLTSYDDFQFYINATGGSAEGGTQAMTITNGGKVGIGAASPSEKLHVEDRIALKGATTTAGIWFYGNNYDSDTGSQFIGRGGSAFPGVGVYIGGSGWKHHFRDTGNVGIGIISSASHTCTVNGSLFYYSGGLNGSDDRIKYNETDVDDALTTIDKLKPQKYEKIMTVPSDSKGTWIPTDEEWEDVKSAEEPPYDGFEYGDEYGFIAQDVRNIPELSFLVSGEETDADGTQTPLGLNYQGVFVVAVKAIQELKAKNEALEARILALENA